MEREKVIEAGERGSKRDRDIESNGWVIEYVCIMYLDRQINKRMSRSTSRVRGAKW